MIAIKFLILVLCVFLSYTLGFIFTETEKYDLQQYRIFDFQAFKCRQCLTFHINWVISTFISLLFNDWLMLIVGFVFSFLLYLGLKLDNDKRLK